MKMKIPDPTSRNLLTRLMLKMLNLSLRLLIALTKAQMTLLMLNLRARHRLHLLRRKLL
jgi:hypothetical protein